MTLLQIPSMQGRDVSENQTKESSQRIGATEILHVVGYYSVPIPWPQSRERERCIMREKLKDRPELGCNSCVNVTNASPIEL